jgi:hypothetical protein
MKPAILTFEAKPAPLAAPRKRSARGRDGGIMFAWSVIGFTSTLIMVGIAFFTYTFTHLP